MADAPTVAPTSVPVQITASAHSPLRKSMGGMFGALVVVSLLIAVVVLVNWRPLPDPIRELDPIPVANLAARELSFPVLVPGAGEGWRATSARLEPTTQSADSSVWFTGWVSPDDEFFSLAQSSATHSAFIGEQTGGGVVVDVGETWPWTDPAGASAGWTAHLSADGKTKSLVRIKGAHTAVASTSSDWVQLKNFVENFSVVDQSRDGKKTLS